MARKVICDQFGFIFIVLVVIQMEFTTTQVTGVPKIPFILSPALSPPQNETGIQSVVINPETRVAPLSIYGQTQTQFGASVPQAQPQPHIPRPYVAAPSSAPPHGARSQQEPMLNTENGFITHQDLLSEQQSNSQQHHSIQYKYHPQQTDLQSPLSVQQYAHPSSGATANQPPTYQQYPQPQFASANQPPTIQHLFQDKYNKQQFPSQDPLSVESSQQYPPQAIQPPTSQQFPQPPFASANQQHIQPYPRAPTNQQYPQPLFQQFSPHELLSASTNLQYPQPPVALTANQQHAIQQYPQPPPPPLVNHQPIIQPFPRPPANERYPQPPPQSAASANQPPVSQQYPQSQPTLANQPPPSQQYPQPPAHQPPASHQYNKPPAQSVLKHRSNVQQYPRPPASQRYPRPGPQHIASANQPPSSRQYPHPLLTFLANQPPASQQHTRPSPSANQPSESQQYPRPSQPSSPANQLPANQPFPQSLSANNPPTRPQYTQPLESQQYRNSPTNQHYPHPSFSLKNQPLSSQHTEPPFVSSNQTPTSKQHPETLFISANQPPASQQAQFETASANRPRFPSVSNQRQTLALVSKNATHLLTPNQLNTIDVPSVKSHQTKPGRVQVVYIPGNGQRSNKSTMGYFRVIHVSLPSLPVQNTSNVIPSITPDSKNINQEPRTNHQNNKQINPTTKPLTAIDRYFGVTSSITPTTKNISQEPGIDHQNSTQINQTTKPLAAIDRFFGIQNSTNKLTDGQTLDTSYQRPGTQLGSTMKHGKVAAGGLTNQSSVDVIAKNSHVQTSETSYQNPGTQLGSNLNTVQHQKPTAREQTNQSSIDAIAKNRYESIPKVQIPSAVENQKPNASVEIGPNTIPLHRANTSSKSASNFLRRFTQPSEKNHGSSYADFTRLQQQQKPGQVADQPMAYFRRWNGHKDASQSPRNDPMGIYMDFTKSQLNKPAKEIPVAKPSADFARSTGNNELNRRNKYSMFTALMERKMNTKQTIGNPTEQVSVVSTPQNTGLPGHAAALHPAVQEGNFNAQAVSSTSRLQGHGADFRPLLQPSSTFSNPKQTSPTALNTPRGGRLMISNSMLQQIMTDYSTKNNTKNMTLDSNHTKPTLVAPIIGLDVPGLNSTFQQIMPDYSVRNTKKGLPLNQHHPKPTALSFTTGQHIPGSNSTLQQIMTDKSAHNNSQHFPQAIVHSPIHRIDIPVSSQSSISSYEVPASAKIPTTLQNIKMLKNQAKQHQQVADVPASSIRRTDSIYPHEMPISATIPTTLENITLLNNQAQQNHQFADVPVLNPSQHITQHNPYYTKYGHIISQEQGAVPVPRVHSLNLDSPLSIIPRFPGQSQIQEAQNTARDTKTVIPANKLHKQFTLHVQKSKGTVPEYTLGANNTNSEAASNIPFQKITLSGKISLNAKSPVSQQNPQVPVSGTGSSGSGTNVSNYHSSQHHSSQPRYPLDAIPQSPAGQVIGNSMGSPVDFRHRDPMGVGPFEQLLQSHSLSGKSISRSSPLGHAPGPTGPLFPHPNPYGHFSPVSPAFNHGQVNQMPHNNGGSFGQPLHSAQPTQHNPGTVRHIDGLFGQRQQPGQPMQRDPGTVGRNGGSFGLPFQPMQHNPGTVGQTSGSFGQPRSPFQPMQHNPSTIKREGGSFGQPPYPGQPMPRDPGNVRRNGGSFGLSLLPVQPIQHNPALGNALFSTRTSVGPVFPSFSPQLKSVYPQLQAPLPGLANSPVLAPIGIGALQPNITLTSHVTSSAPIDTILSTTVAPGPTFNPDLQCSMQSECEVGCCFDAAGDILWDWKTMINPTITTVGFCHVKEETPLGVSCHNIHCPCMGGDQVCVSIPPRNFTMPSGYDPAEQGVISFGKCRTAGQPVAGIGHLEKAKAMMDMCMLDPACPLHQPMKKK